MTFSRSGCCEEARTSERRTSRSLASPTLTAAVPRLVLCLVDPELTAIHLLAVQVLDRSRGVLTRHLDESETALLSGIAIGRKGYRFDGSMLRKKRADRFFGGRERQIAHIDLAHDSGSCFANASHRF